MTPPEARQADPFARIAPYYDALMANVPYRLWADYVSQLAARARRPITPGSMLLDLATGTGSVGLEFATRGCIVTAIDRSEPMLAQARRKAAEQHLQVSFLCADLADFHLLPEFDHAVCLYDSLNYLLQPAGLKRAFANVRGTLKPGGLFIFDINTVRALEAELFTQKSPAGAPVQYRWNSRYDPKTRITRITMRYRVPETAERFSVIHQQRAYTDAQLRLFLSQAGFRGVTAYEAYRTSPPTAASDRVFYVAVAADRG